ncbi:MAG: hypothetical protein M0Z48_06050 [Nitrospiraceae bacterium]|nr:hypothetical protein [Nitrospiraceae bacterium]
MKKALTWILGLLSIVILLAGCANMQNLTERLRPWIPKKEQAGAVDACNASAGIHITSVSTVYPQLKQRIVIQGTGFGTQDPFNGRNRFISFHDIIAKQWTFYYNSYFYVTQWTDSEIVVNGLPVAFNPGDLVYVYIANPQKTGMCPSPQQPILSNFKGAPYSKYQVNVAAAPSHEVKITSVSPVGPFDSQTIVISGSGFGQNAPFNGNTQYLAIINITESNQIAGKSGGYSINVTRWTNTQVIIDGVQSGFPLKSGDILEFYVADPQASGELPQSESPFEGAPYGKYNVTVGGE